jgi:trimeric autotransporter adhesin
MDLRHKWSSATAKTKTTKNMNTKSTIPRITTPIGRPFLRSALILIEFFLACIALPGRAHAVSPAPDGGYPGGNTAEGQNALFSLTTGTYNTAVGLFSLTRNTEGQFNTAIGAGALLSNTPGSQNGPAGIVNSSQNTATGAGALLSNTIGAHNTADGAFALFSNTTGVENTATGSNALFDNTAGTGNTGDGAFALASNTTGIQNTANGTFALFSNTEGSFNTASGNGALYSNTDGNDNVAIGVSALQSNTDGGNNTANGVAALHNNTIGDQNTASGDQALFNNTTGNNNTANGTSTLHANTTGSSNTAIGINALGANTTGSGNIALGVQAGDGVTTANNVFCIGAFGANVDNSCYIGNIYSNVQPVIGINPDYVTVDSNGRLGRSNLNASSRRFKHDIQPMDKASEVIFQLKPVSFRYNKEYDVTQRPSFGLIAEEVAEVDPDLVGRNKQGEPEAVRYEQINAMLLNEFLKERKKVQQLEAAFAQQRNDFAATIAELRKEIAGIVARSRDQDEKIQKVGAQVELNKTVSRTVANK